MNVKGRAPVVGMWRPRLPLTLLEFWQAVLVGGLLNVLCSVSPVAWRLNAMITLHFLERITGRFVSAHAYLHIHTST